jgi:type VI secretion system secreted protein Hcp
MALCDYFLKLDGIPGESKDHKHKDEIELESWSWGQHQTGTGHSGGGSGAGKVAAQDFHFTMKASKASPKLMLACAEGEHIKKATLVARKAGKGQQEYYFWKFTDVFVSSYQSGGSAHSEVLPTDQVSLNFAKLEVEYKEQKDDGTPGGATSAGYDYKLNKKV